MNNNETKAHIKYLVEFEKENFPKIIKLEELIIKYSNDSDLGKEIREYFQSKAV